MAEENVVELIVIKYVMPEERLERNQTARYEQRSKVRLNNIYKFTSFRGCHDFFPLRGRGTAYKAMFESFKDICISFRNKTNVTD
jgi:hypothetical protein